MTNSASHLSVSDNRARRLGEELAHALRQTQRGDLAAWGARSGKRFVGLTGRRIKGLAALAVSLGKLGSREARDLLTAMRAGRGGEHFGNRSAAAIDGSIDIAKNGKQVLIAIGSSLKADPKANAPRVVAAFLGFYAGSGWLDGNGGIPDLDLLAGIDAHRSILTHSILAGVVAEGLLLASADLAVVVHDKLPEVHDPLWDKLAESFTPLTASLASGASAGIAYHLLVDAAIQPAPYHGLPFSMPLEAHQTAMVTNALAEGMDTVGRHSGKQVAVDHQRSSEKTTGRKVVDAVGQSASNAMAYAKGFLQGWRSNARPK